METLWQHALLLLNISSKIQMHPSGRNLACFIYSGFVFPFFFPLNLSQCDCFTGILISHYLIASITLKIRSQHWSKICNFLWKMETIQVIFSKILFAISKWYIRKEKLCTGNYINVTTNTSHTTKRTKRYISSNLSNIRPDTILVDLFKIVLLYFSSLVWWFK